MTTLLARLRALANTLFRRSTIDRDLDDELHSYVDLVASELVRKGRSPTEAHRAAIADLGGVEPVKENVRDARTGATLEILARDLRFGARSLAKTPSFTAAAVIALALGIGATTAILSVVNAVLLRPLAYADAERLVVILNDRRNPVSPANFTDWRRLTNSYTEMAAAEYWSPNLGGIDDPERITALHLTAGMLPMLGVRPLLGRVFTPDEDRPGNDRVVVIGHGLWQRRFAGDPSVVGSRILLDGNQYTIIGVMPRSFQFAPFWATRAELWAPLALGERATVSRGGNSLRVFARLRDGMTYERAAAELKAVTANLEQQFPGTNRTVRLTPLKETVVGDIRAPLVVLLVAVTFVLLIACANVAHMLLARAAARHRELAVRTALGATKGRIVAQLLVESLLLAAAGGVAGLAFAQLSVNTLVAAAPAMIPRVALVTIDARVLVMTVAITALTAVVFGLVPAVRAAGLDLAGTFRDGDRASTEGRSRHRLRGALVSCEFALALVLLVGAGLMIRSFTALRAVDPGFDPEHVVAMSVSVAGTRFAESGARAGFYDEVLGRVRAVPGVAQVSYINHLPLAGDVWGYEFAVEGSPPAKPGEAPGAIYRVVFPGYFRTMRIPMLQGREFTEGDGESAPRSVIVNDFMAKRRWPGESAIGKRIAINRDTAWVTVVGVAKNAAISDWGGPPQEEMYLPFQQSASYSTNPASRYAYLTLVARIECARQSRCADADAVAPIVAAIRGVERSVPISEVHTMVSVVGEATAESRFYVVLLAAFAAIALALAAVGIYGVMSYSVSRRTNEIGIRIALGAERGQVLRVIVGDGMSVALIGAGAGLLGAFALTRLMGRLLYGVQATDPITFAAVTIVLCGVALVACYLPARRATRIDPLKALRAE